MTPGKALFSIVGLIAKYHHSSKEILIKTHTELFLLTLKKIFGTIVMEFLISINVYKLITRANAFQFLIQDFKSQNISKFYEQQYIANVRCSH